MTNQVKQDRLAFYDALLLGRYNPWARYSNKEENILAAKAVGMLFLLPLRLIVSGVCSKRQNRR